MTQDREKATEIDWIRSWETFKDEQKRCDTISLLLDRYLKIEEKYCLSRILYEQQEIVDQLEEHLVKFDELGDEIVDDYAFDNDIYFADKIEEDELPFSIVQEHELEEAIREVGGDASEEELK